MIGEAWGRFQSYTLSMLFGGGFLILFGAAGIACGYWLAWRRRAALIDLAVKRDRVLQAAEDAVAETVPLPAQRRAGES